MMCDDALCRARNLVGRLSGKSRWFRSVATRCDRLLTHDQDIVPITPVAVLLR